MASIKLTNEFVEARVEILQGQENYLAWKRDLKFIAEANDVWKILNGEEIIQDKPKRPILSNTQVSSGPATRSSVKDAEQSSVDAQASDQLSLIIQFYKLDLDEFEKQQKRFRFARGLLSTTINTALRGCIKDEDNPYQAMENLKGLCKMNDARALDMTLGKIEQLKFKSSVSDLINTLKTYQQDILDLNGTFSDEQLMSKVVRSLPNRFNRFLDSWNLLAGTAALPRDLVTLHGHLLGIEAQLAPEKDNKDGDTKSKVKNKKERQICDGCNKWATHNESECWIAHPELREDKFNRNGQNPKTIKKEVNTVTRKESKGDSEPQHSLKRPARVVATIAINRDEWEATCKSSGSDKKMKNLNRKNDPDGELLADSQRVERTQPTAIIQPQTMMLLQDETVERNSKWIIDSGANICIANDKTWFSDFHKVTYTVGTANNSGLCIEGTGTVPLQLITDGNDPVELELHNVAYAQNARCNILSLSWIAEKAKLRGVWGIDGISIKTAEGFEIGYASLIDGLFHLQIDLPITEHPSDVHPSQGEPVLLQTSDTGKAEAMRESSAPTPDQQLPPGVQPPFVVSLLDYDDSVWKWHRRMGHLSIQSLRDLLKVSDGIDLTDKQLQGKLGVICPVCATTRAVNKVPRDPATRRATSPGAIMHADAWGPYPVKAWDGTAYILAITDDATRFTWSARYATKEKIPETFPHLHRTIEKRNDINIRAYRLDNEFPSHGELQDWFQRHAISLEATVPYTHHMNGVAERGFRTDRERASAMLQEATNSISVTISKILGTRTEETMRDVSLSETLWVEAFSHAIWIKNRSPSRALEGKITPWEAFYKIRPNLAVERIFGSRVYVTCPPEFRRKSLLQARGWIGYFVGFETEAVLRIWAPEKNRVVRVTAPRVDDGQGQNDAHDGETFRDRVIIDDINVDDLSSVDEEDLEASEVSPHSPRPDQYSEHPPGKVNDDQLSTRSESPFEIQSLHPSVNSDHESGDDQEEASEMGQIHRAFAEEGFDYETWDGDYAYHVQQNTSPQVFMLLGRTTPKSTNGDDRDDGTDGQSIKLVPNSLSKNIKVCFECQITHDNCDGDRDSSDPCNHCKQKGINCVFSNQPSTAEDPNNSRPARFGQQPPQEKCGQCRKRSSVCKRSIPNSRCDRCLKDKRFCSFMPQDKPKWWSKQMQPLPESCVSCIRQEVVCVLTDDDPTFCTSCRHLKIRCSFSCRNFQDLQEKCELCKSRRTKCKGASPTTKCTQCRRRKARCSLMITETPNNPRCTACCANGPGRRCLGIPCTLCQKRGLSSCSFHIDKHTALYHPIEENLHQNSLWHRTLRLYLQDECCKYCAELMLRDVIFDSDNGFPCNMCVTREQDRKETKKGTTCTKFNDDGGYKKHFFRGTPRTRARPQRLKSPPPMTEAGTEDEEEWQTLEDYSMDEDLEKDYDGISADPALAPQANLAITSRFGPLVSLMVSTSIPRRGMAIKGEITTKEATGPRVCMMSASARILGPEPRTRREAMNSPEWKQWEQAMQEEYSSLLENQTWKTVERPTDRKVLTGRWVFKRKLGSDGSITRHKARFVVRGFSQVYGLDFDETYASVVKSASYRILFALQARYGWKCHQMDIKTAFLNGDLEHEIFVEPPDGYPETNGQVLKLCKSLYGLKQLDTMITC